MLPLQGGRLSKPLPSTTRPTLHLKLCNYKTIITPLSNSVNKYLAEGWRNRNPGLSAPTVFKTVPASPAGQPSVVLGIFVSGT
jgi:hypothetical protein